MMKNQDETEFYASYYGIPLRAAEIDALYYDTRTNPHESLVPRQTEKFGTWLSVKEKLPPHDERVIVRVVYVETAPCQAFIDFDSRTFYDTWRRYPSDNGAEITHWTPMPEFPADGVA